MCEGRHTRVAPTAFKPLAHEPLQLLTISLPFFPDIHWERWSHIFPLHGCGHPGGGGPCALGRASLHAEGSLDAGTWGGGHGAQRQRPLGGGRVSVRSKGRWRGQEQRGSRKDPYRFQREPGPVDASISGFWPPDSETVHFCSPALWWS